jgi:hypothetical protein
MGFDIKDANFEGINALGQAGGDRRFYFSSWYGNSPLGFVQNDRKYIFYPSTDKVFAFDLAADPAETTPITVNEAVANKIKQQVLSWQHYSRRIKIDNKVQTSQILYNKWQTFSEGTNVWANYLDKNKRLSKSLR